MTPTPHATVTWLAGLATGLALSAPALAVKPEPKPSPSPAAVGNSQISKLPAGVDTGVPGTSQTPPLSGTGTSDKTRRSVLRRQAAAASGPSVDDSAAARAAARPEPASSPAPSRKP